MKLASLARVSHLATMREQWLRALDEPVRLTVRDVVRGNVADDAMVAAITPALHAEIQRRIDIVETELLELGMSIG